jgi:prepilin-type N-terminal cleavage/methylation domain-containing protein
MLKTKKTGFTLVELLVVIAIIGLLSTIAVVSLGTARGKARDTKRIADTKQIATALEQYYNDVNSYPGAIAAGAALGAGSGQTNCTGSVACTCLSSGSGFLNTCSGTTYMGSIPAYPAPPTNAACTAGSTYAAPATIANYCYYSSTTSAASTDYKLTFHLEANNTALGGDDCIMMNSGTTCS